MSSWKNRKLWSFIFLLARLKIYFVSFDRQARWKEKKSWGIYDNFYLIKAQATSIVACGNQNQLISKFESDSRALDGIRLKVITNKKKTHVSPWKKLRWDHQRTKLVEKNVEIQIQACWKRSRRREVRQTNTEIHFSFRDLENHFSFLPSPSLVPSPGFECRKKKKNQKEEWTFKNLSRQRGSTSRVCSSRIL